MDSASTEAGDQGFMVGKMNSGGGGSEVMSVSVTRLQVSAEDS